jgi:threonine synthase
MDVGNPSNFIRIQEIYKNNFENLKAKLSSYSFTDRETKGAIKEIYNDYSYVADPHGAVGYLGCKAYLKEHPKSFCVFLERAHPTKFLDVVEDTIRENIDLPEQILSVMDKKKKSVKINTYEDLKGYLLTSSLQ